MAITDRSLSSLQPVFRTKVERWLNHVLAESKSSTGPLAGVELLILETLRTFERSDELFAQGRTKPGPIVTNAKAGQSFHNFGLAVDVGPRYRGKEFTWAWDRDPKLMAAMRRAANLAKLEGIDWGGDWRGFVDLPHFQDSEAPKLPECRRKWPKGWQGVSHA